MKDTKLYALEFFGSCHLTKTYEIIKRKNLLLLLIIIYENLNGEKMLFLYDFEIMSLKLSAFVNINY